MRIHLCVHPTSAREATDCGFPLCHMAYRIGESFDLYRSGLGLSIRGGTMLLSDYGLSAQTVYSDALMRSIRRECDRRGFDGVYCDFETGLSPALMRFAREASEYLTAVGISFYLPRAFERAAPSAGILLSSAVTGGTCSKIYRQLFTKYGHRAALVYEPLMVDFIMPAPRSGKRQLTPQSLQTLMKQQHATPYFSQELSARYFTYRDPDGLSHFVLYDDSHSLAKKLSLAEQIGFQDAFVFYSEAAEVLDELRGIAHTQKDPDTQQTT